MKEASDLLSFWLHQYPNENQRILWVERRRIMFLLTILSNFVQPTIINKINPKNKLPQKRKEFLSCSFWILICVKREKYLLELAWYIGSFVWFMKDYNCCTNYSQSIKLGSFLVQWVRCLQFSSPHNDHLF